MVTTHPLRTRDRHHISTEALALRVSALEAVRESGRIAVRIINPGWGSSGYYSAEMLERDGPRIFTAGTHMYLDHPGNFENMDRPERTVRDLAAVLSTDARWESDGPDGPGLFAEAEVLPSNRELIGELAPHIGVSIRAFGLSEWGEAEGREGWIVTALLEAQSVDFVTMPGRGGRVLEVIESAHRRGEGDLDMDALQEAIAARTAAETRATAAEAQVASLTATVAERDARIAELEQQVARHNEAAVLREAREVVAEAVRDADVPDITRTRLVDQVAANPPTRQDGTLDREALTTRTTQAVEAEIAYLAAATGRGRPTNVGAGSEAGTPDPEADFRFFREKLGMSEEAARAAAAGR